MGPSTTRVWSRYPRQKGVWQPSIPSSIKTSQWISHQERKGDWRRIPRQDTHGSKLQGRGLKYKDWKILHMKLQNYP